MAFAESTTGPASPAVDRRKSKSKTNLLEDPGMSPSRGPGPGHREEARAAGGSRLARRRMTEVPALSCKEREFLAGRELHTTGRRLSVFAESPGSATSSRNSSTQVIVSLDWPLLAAVECRTARAPARRL